MNTHEDPFTLLEQRTFLTPALSLYLPIEPGAFDPRRYPPLLASLEREELDRLEPDRAQALHHELGRALEAIEARRPSGTAGLALFSHQASDLLRVWRLPEAVGPMLAIGHRLELGPVRRLLDEHPPALVVVADKERALIFSVVLDEVREEATFLGQEIDRQKQGGWSADIYARTEDMHARQNLEPVADRTARLAAGGFVRRLFLAGPPEARAELEALLPEPAARLLAGQFQLPLYATSGQLAEEIRHRLAA